MKTTFRPKCFVLSVHFFKVHAGIQPRLTAGVQPGTLCSAETPAFGCDGQSALLTLPLHKVFGHSLLIIEGPSKNFLTSSSWTWGSISSLRVFQTLIIIIQAVNQGRKGYIKQSQTGPLRQDCLEPLKCSQRTEIPQRGTSLNVQHFLHRAFHGISSLLNIWGNACRSPKMVLHPDLLFLS